MVGPTCPIPNTHRRLEAAHRLWHEALKHYDDPDAFRTFLNSAVQELRNVTWVLQKEKFSAPGFDEWYAAWQKRLAASDAARWIVKLRNKVVKEGDLQTASRVHVRYVVGYREVALFKFDGPPTASSADIAHAFATGAPEAVREDALLVVERRWETTDLPGKELLDALASAYGLLADLVNDAHKVVGVTGCGVIGCGNSGPKYAAEFLAGTPSCMAVSQDSRTSTIDLERRWFRQSRSRIVKAPTKLRGQELLQKYAVRPLDWKRLKDLPLRGQAHALHEVGLNLLQADGFLVHTFHLFRGRELVALLAIQRPDERIDLRVAMLRMRKEVERTRADSLISSNEIWISTGKSGLSATDDPDHREGVHTVAADRDGYRLALTTPFRRESGKIVLEATFEDEGALLPYLEPILDYWRSRGAK